MLLTPATMYKLHAVSTQHDEAVLEETAECFPSFTCYLASDFTHARMSGHAPTQDDGLIIEVLGNPSDTPLVKALAESIQHFTKYPVLITVHQLEILA